MSERTGFIAVLAIAAVALAATPSFAADTVFFSETWQGAALQTIPAGNGSTPTYASFQADNTTTYCQEANAPALNIIDITTPSITRVLDHPTVGSNAPAQSQFMAAIPSQLRIGDVGAITLKATYIPRVYTGNTARLCWMQAINAANTQDYGMYADCSNAAGAPEKFEFRIRTATATTPFDLSTGYPDLVVGDAYEVAAAFTKLAEGSTKLDYTIIQNHAGAKTTYTSGTYTFSNSLDDSTVLKNVYTLYRQRALFSVDDLQVLAGPPVQLPVLSYSTNPIYISAPASSPSTTTVTIRNTGKADLHVASVDIPSQSNPNAFTVLTSVSDVTVTTDSPGLPVLLQFDSSMLTPQGNLATAVLKIVSDTGGTSDTETSTTLTGYRVDTFTWNTGREANWTDSTAWTPQGVPGREDTAIIDSGVTSRDLTLIVDPTAASQSYGITSLSLTGGEFCIGSPTNAQNFTMVQSDGGHSAFALDGGHLILPGGSLYLANRPNSVVDLKVLSGAIDTYRAINAGSDNPSTAIVTMSGGRVSLLSSSYDVNIGEWTNSYASWTHTGGTLNIGRDLVLALGTGAQGVFDVSGGTVNVANRIMVGDNGPGTLNISGGGVVNINSTTSDTTVSHTANGKGAINVSGGELNFNSPRSIYLAYATDTTGSMTISSGSVTLSDSAADLTVGRQGAGYLTMSGGQLSVGEHLIVGGSGTASIGYADLSGGVVSTRLDLYNNGGEGHLRIHGDVDITVGRNLKFGSAANGHASFDMSGGKLKAGQINKGSSTHAVDSWSWTGGTIVVSTASLPVTMTNGGGALAPGDAGIGTTVFSANTTYTQTAGSIEIGIQDNGVADQILLTSATANLLGGSIDVALTGGEPALGGSWDIVAANGAGGINVGAVTVNLPGPAGFWEVTSDSTKVTVVFHKPPTLIADVGTTAVIPTIISSTGGTSNSKTFNIQNIGESDLTVSSFTIAGAGFTLLEPTTVPLLMTAGATESVTVEFDAPSTSTAVYYGSLTFESNDPFSPLLIGLKAEVSETIKSAASVETWVRY